MQIHETFQKTIQGEGYHFGRLADFIRLSGCPVGCSFCDTGYSEQDDNGKNAPRYQMTISDLLNELRSPLVVITGGEPFIHRDLPDLVDAIIETGRDLAIETSGSFYQLVNDKAWITLSPKHHMNSLYPVHAKIWARANEIKLVISDGTELDFYRENLLKKSCPIFLQPEWNDKLNTLQTSLKLLESHPTYRLSIQAHKMIGMP